MKSILKLAAGAAAIYFLKTNSGKQLLKSLKLQAADLGHNFKGIAGDLYKEGLTYGDRPGGMAEVTNKV